jgi:hypothetical protein
LVVAGQNIQLGLSLLYGVAQGGQFFVGNNQ